MLTQNCQNNLHSFIAAETCTETRIMKMKAIKKFLSILLCLGLVLSLFGCGKKVPSGADNTEQSNVPGTEESASTTLSAAAQKLADGSYHYKETFRTTLNPDSSEDVFDHYLVADGAMCYSFYHSDSPDYRTEDYALIRFTDESGTPTETKFFNSFFSELFDLAYMSRVRFYPVAGCEEYLLSHHSLGTSQACIINTKGEVLVNTVLPISIAEESYHEEYGKIVLTPEYDMMADAAHNVYMAWQPTSENRFCFMVSDKDGGLLWEDSIAGDFTIDNMLILPDGTVGCMLYSTPTTDKDTWGYCLVSLHPEDGMEIVAQIDAQKLYMRQCLTCYDDQTFLYANLDGLYRCSYDGENTEELYLWAEHGVNIDKLTRVDKLLVQSDGDIEVLLRSENTLTYLMLELTDREDNVLEIPFAIASYAQRDYQRAVAEFNHKYPDYKIHLTVYEDTTQLLTELISGTGPVLIDTNLISLADNEELWECLDDALAEWGLRDVLLENTLQGGQINGRQYGLSFSWQLISFATTSYQKESWNYEEFLTYIKENPGLEMLYYDQSPINFMSWFLSRDLSESYFIDESADAAYFDTERFTGAISLAKRLTTENAPMGEDEQIARIRQGRCLGEFVYLTSADMTAYYDARLGENINYIGFPGAGGSCHYINTNAPVAIRNTASEAQKEAALLFLKELLAADIQRDLVSEFGFSVRRDVFEEQLADVKEEVTYIMNGEELVLPVDTAATRERLLSLYENAMPFPDMPAGISDALFEELYACFYENRDAEEIGTILQNRVMLYLKERE